MTFKEFQDEYNNGEVTHSVYTTTRDKLVEMSTDSLDFHIEYVLENWRNALAQVGIDVDKIYYSFCHSQSDHVMFNVKSINFQDFFEFWVSKTKESDIIRSDKNGQEDFRGWLVKKIGGLPIEIDHRFEWLLSTDELANLSGRFVIERYSCRLDYLQFDSCYTETLEEVIHELVFDDFNSFINTVYSAILYDMNSEYNYLCTDESILEYCEMNELEFDINGLVDY